MCDLNFVVKHFLKDFKARCGNFHFDIEEVVCNFSVVCEKYWQSCYICYSGYRRLLINVHSGIHIAFYSIIFQIQCQSLFMWLTLSYERF